MASHIATTTAVLLALLGAVVIIAITCSLLYYRRYIDRYTAVANSIENTISCPCTYGGDCALIVDLQLAAPAFVADGNKAGAQFHPEKSQTLGLALITNFLRWKP